MKSDNSGQCGVPSQRRGPRIDEEILKTALKLFLEQGVEGANAHPRHCFIQD